MNDETTPGTPETADTAKTEAIGQLGTAIRELETGEDLTALVGGHGFQSRTFEFAWTTPTLEISLSMPYDRVFSGDETRQEDNAAIGAACRLAILLIEADAAGTLLADGETSMSVTFDQLSGARFLTAGADGEIVDSGDDWSALVARMERVFPSDTPDALSIIWP